MRIHMRQRGVVSVGFVIVVAMVLAAVVGLIVIQQKRLEDAKADLATAQAEVVKANASIKTMALTNQSLQSTITAMKELTTIQQEELKKHQTEKAVIEKKVEGVMKALPPPKAKALEGVATPEDTVMLSVRSQALWVAYCVADSTNAVCTEGATS